MTTQTIPYSNFDQASARFWVLTLIAYLRGDRDGVLAASKAYRGGPSDTLTSRQWAVVNGLIAREAVRQFAVRHPSTDAAAMLRRTGIREVGVSLLSEDVMEEVLAAVGDPDGFPIPLLLLSVDDEDVTAVAAVALCLVVRVVATRLEMERSMAAFEDLRAWVYGCAQVPGYSTGPLDAANMKDECRNLLASWADHGLSQGR